MKPQLLCLARYVRDLSGINTKEIMRQVIINEPIKKIVPYTSCAIDKYYGVLNYSFRETQKGFICSTGYKNNTYRVVAIYGMTHFNGWSQFDGTGLQNIISAVIRSDAKFEVFEFDTPQELFKWLSEP